MDQQTIIGAIRFIEEQLMTYASSVEDSYNIKPGSYRISLLVEPKKEYEKQNIYVSSGIIVAGISLEQKANKNIIKIHNGPVVHIEIAYSLNSSSDPFAFFISAAKLINEAFGYISGGHRVNRDKELFNPTVIGRLIHEWDGTTWNRRPIKKADLDKGSFTRDSYRITVSRIVVVKHRLTGITHVLEDRKGRSGHDLSEQALNECSMIVESKFKSPMIVPIRTVMEARFSVEVIHSMYGSTL